MYCETESSEGRFTGIIKVTQLKNRLEGGYSYFIVFFLRLQTQVHICFVVCKCSVCIEENIVYVLSAHFLLSLSLYKSAQVLWINCISPTSWTLKALRISSNQIKECQNYTS
jgi:hypothetical protein